MLTQQNIALLMMTADEKHRLLMASARRRLRRAASAQLRRDSRDENRPRYRTAEICTDGSRTAYPGETSPAPEKSG